MILQLLSPPVGSPRVLHLSTWPASTPAATQLDVAAKAVVTCVCTCGQQTLSQLADSALQTSPPRPTQWAADSPPASPQPRHSPSSASPCRSAGLAARPHLVSALGGPCPGQGVMDVQQVLVASVIEDRLYLALQTPVLQGRSTLRVARANESTSLVLDN
jgi:hypothetical protein